MLAMGKEVRYRIVPILDAHWEEFFQTKKGWIRAVVLETVRKLRAFRTPALGCHVYQCPQGHEIRIVPHSCKSRSCPTCGKHATDRWADGALGDLLDVPYHHLVLSAPWQVRPIMAFNREVGLSILARAAAGCLPQWARDQHGMRMGIVRVIHTFGADLKWHPHVHLLVTEGGLSLEGDRWIQPYHLGWLMSHAGLKKMWKYHVITAFRQAHKKGQLRFQARSRFLKRYPGFNWLLGELWKLTWYAHIGACLLDPSATLRYSGLFATRWRARHLEQARRALGHDEPSAASEAEATETPLSHRSWRERQQAETGTDPLCCSQCGRSMVLTDVAFGPHPRIAELFRQAGHPARLDHPALAMPP